MYLIDTSAWRSVLGNRPIELVKARVQEIVGRHEAATCPPIVFELLRGIVDQPEAAKLLEYLASLQGFPVDWVAAARWAAAPERRALRVKSMDLLIAHTALVNRAILIHADTDFDRLAKAVPIKVESFVQAVRTAGKRGT